MTGAPVPPRAVIFDCDGVLVDSERPLFDLLTEDLSARGLGLDRDGIERLFLGATIPGGFRHLRAQGVPLPDDWVERFYDRLYARLAEGTPLIPGILGVLDALEAADIPFAVGSNGTDRKMQITIGQHPGLLDRFGGRLFSGQTLGAPKPAPDLYLHAARVLGQPPQACVVVEDSPTGARAAAAAGIPCFGFAPVGDGAALATEGARVFHAMDDLPGLLGLG